MRLPHPSVPLREILVPEVDEVRVEATATYPIAGVYSFGRGLFARPPIAGSETTYPRLYRLHRDQVVYGRLNGREGAIAVVPAEFDGSFVSSEFPTLRIREDVASSDFVQWLVRSPALWAKLLGTARGIGSQRGARRLRVPLERLLATEVPLPSLPEQARIVERMSRVREVRDRTRQAHALAKDLLQSSLSRAISGDHPSVPLREILVPEVDEVRVEATATYPIAGVYSFGRGLFARPPITGSETTYPRLYRLHRDQVVYSRLFAWEGALAIVTEPFDGSFVSPEFPTFHVRDSAATLAYVGWILRSPALWDALRGYTTGLGLRRQRVPLERLLATEVPLPSLPEQARIVERMSRVREVVESMARQTALADALEASTLQRELRMTAEGVSDQA